MRWQLPCVITTLAEKKRLRSIEKACFSFRELLSLLAYYRAPHPGARRKTLLITKITGKLVSLGDSTAIIGVDPFEYEVLIPDFTRRHLQQRIGDSISLHTLHYLDGNPGQGRVQPRLVGFLSEVEREFFELVCSVDGVGVRKALRAMVRPVQDIAVLIEEQDAKGLSTLPGVGSATAERMIAKLRRKMPRFALLVSSYEAATHDVEPNVIEQTYLALCSLGHSESDARRLIGAAMAGKQKFKDPEALLQAIYQANHRNSSEAAAS